MLSLATIFSSGMVLQQQHTIPVWGQAQPETLIQVELAHVSSCTRSSVDGYFRLYLPALPAGGPYQFFVRDLEHGEILGLDDIWIGEVWLASGQSNMEYLLASRPPEELKKYYPTPDLGQIQYEEFKTLLHESSASLHFVVVPPKMTGACECSFDGKWQKMTPENCHQVSAVAAWFAQELQTLHVPIGLIIAAKGSAPIEAWTSRSALMRHPDSRRQVARNDCYVQNPQHWPKHPAADNPEAWLAQVKKHYPVNTGVIAGWAKPDFDDAQWALMNLPGSWIRQGLAGNGTIWLRKTIEVPPELAGQTLQLHLGGIDKQDITYFNGCEVGRTGRGLESEFWNVPRSYTVPGNLVRAGKNTIAIRAFSFIYGGACNGAGDLYALTLPNGAWRLGLSGVWRAQVECDLGGFTPHWGAGAVTTPAILFDSMIRPLYPYALRGVIWYQGESNAISAAEAATYGSKFQALIEDWRMRWEDPELVFIQVQLAAYMKPQDFCATASWAVLREEQNRVTHETPGVYQVTALDCGDEHNVHPLDKKTVGTRLGKVAVKEIYQQNLGCCSGPEVAKIVFEKNQVRITFNQATGLLLRAPVSRSFFLAGSEQKFFPADQGEISGETLILTAQAVPHPVAVRYAWADNPVLGLYNRAGYPAFPFRSDHWSVDETD